MRVVLQRVTRASVAVEDRRVAEIGRGYLLLVGVGRGDGPDEVGRLVDKIVTLRVFPDDGGRMNRSLDEVDGEVLVVPQFTLYGDVRKGRRPSWTDAAGPAEAAILVDSMADRFEALGFPVGRGVFGANMHVDLVNDGPVTLVLDTAAL
jgi:D-tyrosyl-tRNA(Tyr) deacylase